MIKGGFIITAASKIVSAVLSSPYLIRGHIWGGVKKRMAASTYILSRARKSPARTRQNAAKARARPGGHIDAAQ
jgi:hypothetical protein